jgi:hypothetical protein
VLGDKLDQVLEVVVPLVSPRFQQLITLFCHQPLIFLDQFHRLALGALDPTWLEYRRIRLVSGPGDNMMFGQDEKRLGALDKG